MYTLLYHIHIRYSNILSSDCVDATARMYLMNADNTHREKVRGELYKNTMSY